MFHDLYVLEKFEVLELPEFWNGFDHVSMCFLLLLEWDLEHEKKKKS